MSLTRLKSMFIELFIAYKYFIANSSSVKLKIISMNMRAVEIGVRNSCEIIAV